MTTLRDYQQACHDAILAAWGEPGYAKDGAETFRSVLANMPTSAGKTVISGALIATCRPRGRCLFLADTDELCAQPLDKFYKLFKIHAAIEKAGSRAPMMSDVVIGSAQTLAREERLRRFEPNHFSYIFVDEAHRGSDRNKKITDYFTGAKVMGMTATAFRAKLADLSDYYDAVAFEMGMFDLIDEGYIAPLKVLTLPVKVDISAVHQKNGDYDADELSTTIEPYYREICRLVLEHAPDRQVIAYLPLIKSSMDFVTIARGMNIKAEHVDGKSPNREELIKGFARGEFQLLSNSSLLTTGWDCPRVNCLLNLAPTRSAGLFRQKVGRIGRLLPGTVEGITDKEERRAKIAASAKPDSLILDLLWQTERFGLIGPADLIAGNEEEKAAIQMKIAGLSSAQDLQGLSAAVQEEREAALKQALIDAAKRRSKFDDAINLVAAMLHGRKVLNYEPVMKWERMDVTQKQKDWLAKQGIDPESGKDRGHVAAFMNLMFNRKRAGLCSHRAVEALEKKGVKGAISFTKQHAYDVLAGDYPISFGKHSHLGRPLRAIPSSYWEWCLKQDWFAKSFPIEYQWAKGVIRPEGACQCIGNHVAPHCPVHPRDDAEAHLADAHAAEADDPNPRVPKYTDDEIPF